MSTATMSVLFKELNLANASFHNLSECGSIRTKIGVCHIAQSIVEDVASLMFEDCGVNLYDLLCEPENEDSWALSMLAETDITALIMYKENHQNILRFFGDEE